MSFYRKTGITKIKTETKIEYRDVVVQGANVSETRPTDMTKLWIDTSK